MCAFWTNARLGRQAQHHNERNFSVVYDTLFLAEDEGTHRSMGFRNPFSVQSYLSQSNRNIFHAWTRCPCKMPRNLSIIRAVQLVDDVVSFCVSFDFQQPLSWNNPGLNVLSEASKSKTRTYQNNWIQMSSKLARSLEISSKRRFW